MYSQKAIKYYEQGRLLQQQNQLAAAERAYRKAIKTDKNFVEAYNNLGNVLVDRGQLREAYATYRKAHKLLPDHPMLLNNLGHVLQLRGEAEAAAGWFRKAIASDPGYADAHVNLGSVLAETGNHEAAVDAYRRAISVDSGNAEALVSLGMSLVMTNRFDDAVDVLEQAIRIDSDKAKAYLELGNALDHRGEPRGALQAYDKAIELDPNYTAAHVRRGATLKDLRQWDDAIASFERAIAIVTDNDAQEHAFDPSLVAAYQELSTLKNLDDNPDMIGMLERQARDPGLSTQNRIRVNFALGNAYAERADFEQSFSFYQRGNRLAWESLDYDVHLETARLDKIKAAFPAGVFADAPVVKATAVTPIFVVGLPRSGKSLTETILSRHPQVYAAGEVYHLERVLEQVGDLNNPGAMVEALLQCTAGELQEIAQDYVDALGRHAQDAAFVVNTMPGNFYHMGYIKLLLPSACVIHCHRQPMDACWFLYQQYFRYRTFQYSFDLEALATYYRAYIDMMRHWQVAFPGYIHDLEYESLVSNSRQEMAALFNVLGLEWDGIALDRYENAPLNDSSVGFWRHYAQHLGTLRDALEI